MLCQRTSLDVTCGASSSLSRILSEPGARDAATCEQEPVRKDRNLMGMDDADILDVCHMPPCVADFCRDEHATCGFIYARGRVQVWANARCEEDYFSTEEANDRLDEMGVLPCFLFGRCVRPTDQPRGRTWSPPPRSISRQPSLPTAFPRHPPHPNSVIVPESRPTFYTNLIDYVLAGNLQKEEMTCMFMVSYIHLWPTLRESRNPRSGLNQPIHPPTQHRPGSATAARSRAS